MYLNGVELFVIADSLEIHDISDGMFPLVTMTFAPRTLTVTSREDD